MRPRELSPVSDFRRWIARLCGVALLASLGALAAPAAAQLDISAGVTAGTLGIGLQGDILIVSHLGGRVIFNGLAQLTLNQTNSGITYNGKLTLQNIPILLDYYPSSTGSFHLTGGVVLNSNKVNATAVIAQGDSIKISGTYYSQAQLGGPMVETITYPSTAWYAGFGMGTPKRSGSRFGFLFDIGVMGSTPKVYLTAPAAVTDPALLADLQAQTATTQAKLKKAATYYPALSIGMNYKF